MAGITLQREGLKASEVFLIVKRLGQLIEDGESEDVAYALAIREVPGASSETFAKWKPDIFKLMRSEDTPALSLLSGSASPGTTQPRDAEMLKRFKQLGERLDTVESDHARLTREKADADAQLAKARADAEANRLELAAVRAENEKLRVAALEGGEDPKTKKK